MSRASTDTVRRDCVGVTSMRDVDGHPVTGNYFDLLGVQPQVGRLIHAEDEHGPNSAPYIVLSEVFGEAIQR